MKKANKPSKSNKSKSQAKKAVTTKQTEATSVQTVANQAQFSMNDMLSITNGGMDVQSIVMTILEKFISKNPTGKIFMSGLKLWEDSSNFLATLEGVLSLVDRINGHIPTVHLHEKDKNEIKRHVDRAFLFFGDKKKANVQPVEPPKKAHRSESSEEKLDSILNELKDMKAKKETKREEVRELSEIKSSLKSIMETLSDLKEKKEIISTPANEMDVDIVGTKGDLPYRTDFKKILDESLDEHYKRVSMMAFKRESTIIGEIWKLSRGEAMFTEEWLDKFMDAIDGDDRFELIMSDSFYREWAAIMRHFGL